MKGNYLEAEKLIDCLKAVINQQKLPQNDYSIDWELFYKTADYHHVSNMVYYAALGMRPSPPQDWMARFAGRYHKAVVSEEQFRNLVEAVLWNCEQSKIHIMALDNWIYQSFYPMPEMRLTDEAGFWVEGKKRADVDRMMYRLDFVPEDTDRPGVFSYVRSGIRLVYYERLEYGSRKLTAYFRGAVKSLPKEEGKEYVHKMEEPGLFVFLLCNKAQRFAEGVFDLRDMVDIWLYYRSVIRGSSWKFIMKRLTRLGIWNFTNRMLALADIWFGGGNPVDEMEILEELENYIFYKGTQGQETAMKVLPLLRQIVRSQKKKVKKDRRKKIQRWAFPGRDYMVLIYPRMGRYRLLLPVCWCRRLVRSFFQYCRMRARNKRNSDKVS